MSAVTQFFLEYAAATNANDGSFFASAYAGTFTFAAPAAARTLTRDDLLAALPRRQAFFKSAGLRETKVQSVEELRLDDRYVMARVVWSLDFGQRGPLEALATYVLRSEGDGLQIVFQLDHQDLAAHFAATP